MTTTTYEHSTTTESPSTTSEQVTIELAPPGIELGGFERDTRDFRTRVVHGWPHVVDGYPEIGIITELQTDDLDCHATVLDTYGFRSLVRATYEICEQADVIVDRSARFIYEARSVADCESSEPCGQTRDEFLISETLMLGDNWLVLVNDSWVVTVGNLDSLAEANDAEDITYYGCSATAGAIAPDLDTAKLGCLSLKGGTAGCSGGVCTMEWREATGKSI